jgi:2-polyprenyl-3-methyl-5-hydroxy-6-metoxy-1,4-benzoquinol methylase
MTAQPSANPAAQPNPGLIFETMNRYQHTMALKGAIELEIFTHIGDGATSAAAIAKRAKASERGMRILCDYLTIIGFLTKSEGAYGLTQDSAMFLSKRSPAYMGTISTFVASEAMLSGFRDVAGLVRNGGTLQAGGGAVEAENPIWVEFARSMVPIIIVPAKMIAPMVGGTGRKKVLDIAAGHGMFGISVAQANPAAQIVALDWKNVLEVAIENATRAGIMDRFTTIAGSAFEADLGTGYDLVLLPNFLHHFDARTNLGLLKRIRAAMKPEGQVATVEFVPNEDRVTPPQAATFSMMMLGSTPGGDAYTFAELDGMFRAAGFGESTMQDLQPSPERLVLTKYA